MDALSNFKRALADIETILAVQTTLTDETLYNIIAALAHHSSNLMAAYELTNEGLISVYQQRYPDEYVLTTDEVAV